MNRSADVEKIHGYCSLCIARCGCIATVEDGRFTRLDPDPAHPTGQALCAKGRAAPELVYSPDRLTVPLKRTRPKGEADPGWVAITWDEALDTIAGAMKRIAAEHGPHAMAFSQSSPSTTAIADSAPFVRRLMNAYGTPNMVWALDMCGWGRGFATRYAFGHGSVATGSAGGGMADIANAGCLILWGYNPAANRLTHATAAVAAQKRGMKVIVIDPRRAGLANKADHWLRVRPGTDGALALGLAHILIRNGWYDRAFVRDWTNGPHLVREDTGAPLRASEVLDGGDAAHFVGWDGRAVAYDPAEGRYDGVAESLVLDGAVRVPARGGAIVCRPMFDHYAALCASYPPERVEELCWIPRAELEAVAHTIWHARPTAYYAWSGHEHHANTTETARAMALLYALTGCFDAPGGNVLFPAVPSPVVTGEDLPAAKTMAPAIGKEQRPLGPAKWNNVAPVDFYTAVLEGTPYRMHGLLGFGSNLLMAFADPVRGRQALAKLDFFAHVDLFMTPTAEVADIVLPVASAFEREALKLGFEISPEAQSLVQLRPAVVPPRGQARSDTDIIFDLAVRLGLGAQFWDGDAQAAYRHQLKPSGIALEDLRAHPEGIRVPLSTTHRKHAQTAANGSPRGFPTPSRRVELWSETLRAGGYSPLPGFVAPPGLASGSDLAARYPLLLTCAKPTVFCQTQHRALPSLRRKAMDPEIEIHPDAAAARGIGAGDWVRLQTATGAMRARVRLNAALDPRVVVGEHGWWQASREAGAPGYDPFSPDGSNLNLTVDPTARDPVSGTISHRANRCEVLPLP
jgi:anaerobic selenocysteine-containing dehydrogenase